MQKIRIITDSACDLPDDTARKLGILVLPIPISHAGRSYSERVEMTNEQFYQLILGSKEIPTTSHINASRYVEEYARAFREGITHLLNVTINSLGSSMFDAASLAKQMFYEQNPAARGTFRIEVVDSKTYSMAYGIAVQHAAEMAATGTDFDGILAYLHDWFDRLEILFSAYSLDFVKKSGRVGCAAAFVGELLGLRPMILFTDGVASIIDKARGNRNVVPKLLDVVKRRVRDPEKYPFLIIRGTPVEEAGELGRMIAGQMPQVHIDGIYSVGASVSINCGPSVVALVYAGRKRGK